jgi:condensin-2 complex subunit D3
MCEDVLLRRVFQLSVLESLLLPPHAVAAAAADVAVCRDSHELVRRQALALLANLLMKDYVKWRGTLFHRWGCGHAGPLVCILWL